MNTFLSEFKDKTLRFWHYKRPGVSYDYGCGHECSGPYIQDECDYGTLHGFYNLPDGDVLLCFENDLGDGKKYLDFYKLSEIDIAYSDTDQE